MPDLAESAPRPRPRPLTGATLLAGVLACLGLLASGPVDPPAPGGGLRLDPATAPAARFTLLPGIGPVLANRIVETRRRIGGIESVEDLAIVPGVGPRTVEAIRTRLSAAGSASAGAR